MRALIGLAALLVSTSAIAQDYPDGTLAFSSSRGVIGRIARRITGQHYTHVGVVIDGYVYDHDWPRAHRTTAACYVKRRWTTDYYTPSTPYTAGEVIAMRKAATSRLGEPYRLRGFFLRRSTGTAGQWCSPYAAEILNASGRYRLSNKDAHTPGNLKAAVGHRYRFESRETR